MKSSIDCLKNEVRDLRKSLAVCSEEKVRGTGGRKATKAIENLPFDEETSLEEWFSKLKNGHNFKSDAVS